MCIRDSPNNSVDVIGDGVELPFKDNTFDAILSHAVFEHVRYPFESAKELIRVLKPQGSLYISVPFLFHEHGYPNHFYNMTQSGLLNLFGDSILVKEIGVFNNGYPICFLTAYLDHYVKGLPEKVAKKFKKMKMGDFLTHYVDHLHENYVTELDQETNKKLACVNSLIATKK